MLPIADGSVRRRRVPRAWFALLVALGCSLHAGAGTPTLELDRYRGKVVVLDFWASWCKPCRQSIPWLNEMKSRYANEGLVVIGVNVDAKHADAERFMRTVPIDFDVVFDPQGELARRYQLKGMPSSFVFDRAGKAQKSAHETELKRLLSTDTH